MGIRVTSLVVEITRRCNMACEHCLRGDAENVDISKKVIDSVAKNVEGISCITLSGGEPSLCVPLIKDLRNQLEINNVLVDSFYVVTNGKDTEKIIELANETMFWNAYCATNNCFDEQASGLALSRDQYHDPIPEFNELFLRGLSYFREDKMYENLKDLVNEGRAYENGIGTFSRDDSIDIMFEDDDIVIDDSLYINVHGDVVPGCDYSYETQRELSWGNILEDSLEDILVRKYKERHNIIEIEEMKKSA